MPRNSFARLLTAACLCGFLIASPARCPGAETYATPEEAAKDPDFAVQGEYRGENRGIQVVALGDGKFSLVEFEGGLPGAGGNWASRKVTEGDAAKVKEATKGLDRVDRRSPSLGAKPPEGAIVLFDGTKESLDKNWKPGAKMTDDGLLMQGCTSKEGFQSYTFHVEFRLPYMPKARGQARGNSGYYIQGRYECQMLDSFGLEGLDNECGGIYSISKPDVNMCFPPLSWQSYDVDYTAAQFDDSGKKTKNSHVVVKHNGVVIHDRDLTKGTPGGPVNGEIPGPGPVYFQDHGNPVRYRNIWIVPKS